MQCRGSTPVRLGCHHAAVSQAECEKNVCIWDAAPTDGITCYISNFEGKLQLL